MHRSSTTRNGISTGAALALASALLVASPAIPAQAAPTAPAAPDQGVAQLLPASPGGPARAEKPAPPESSTEQRPLPSEADYRSAADLAISLSYPLYGDGTKPDPRARIPGGPVDRTLVSPLYKAVKHRSWEVSSEHDNMSPSWAEKSYANCSAFTSTAVIQTQDPKFPGNLVKHQREYVKHPENGWVQVADSDSDDYDERDLRAGDIFLSKPKEGVGDHTWMWIGTHEGVDNVVAQASYARTGGNALLPALQINPLDLTGTSTDRSGRSYKIWRYSGSPALTRSELGAQLDGMRVIAPGDMNGDGEPDLLAHDERSGALWLHPGLTKGRYGERQRLGSDFAEVRGLVGIGDLDGDGARDLLGLRGETGTVVMWPGTGDGRITAGVELEGPWL